MLEVPTPSLRADEGTQEARIALASAGEHASDEILPS
jgi:hypothetical protein